ncbi:MAG: peptidase M6 [Calditrichaeota bacterium]|nr:peptidase M6 [candidate division KSB1 bacterium]MCZ6820787.1 peptidase M6 [Calditrichota bacterium]
MNFSNTRVTRTFVSPHSQNAYGLLQGIGWRKVKTLSNDGVTNVFTMLSAAKSHNRTVSGTIDATNQISILYLN